MSTFPTDWLNRVSVTVNPDLVVGTSHDDFQLPISRANLPDEMLDPTGTNHAQSDGGDIRVSLDQAGTQQLPLEVFNFQLDSATGAKDAQIGVWIKIPTLTSTTQIWVWWGSATTQTKAADTDPYGRNAVWSNHIAVYHAPNVSGVSVTRTFTDSTGNGYTFSDTKTYSGTAHPVFGTLTTAVKYNSIGSSPLLPLDQDYTILDLVNTPDYAASGDRTWLTITGNNNASTALKFWLPSATEMYYVYDSTGTGVSLGGSVPSRTLATWYWTSVSTTVGTGTQTAYVNGAALTPQTVERVSGTGVLTPGAGGNAVNHAEIWIAKGIWSADRHQTTVNSQASASSFLVTGTPESVSGTVAVSVDITSTSMAFTGQSTPVALSDLPAEGFQLLGTINIPSTSEDLVDFPVFMNRSCFPDSLFDPSGTRRFQADGGDLRITTDEEGTVKLPVDITIFALDSATAAKDAIVALTFTAPLLSSANSETYYLWGAASTTKTQPTVTEPFGANEVWADYEFVCHLGRLSLADSANNHTITKVGATSLANMGATYGYQFGNLAGTTANNYAYSSISNVGNSFTLSFLAYPDSDFNNQKLVTLASGTTAEHFVDTDNNYFLRGVVNTNGIASTGADLAQTQNFYHLTWDGGTVTLYKDGVSVASQAYTTTANPVDTIILAAGDISGTGAYAGKLAEVRLRRSPVSAAWALYESTNYGSIASFVSVTESTNPTVSVDITRAALALSGVQLTINAGWNASLSANSILFTSNSLTPVIGQRHNLSPNGVTFIPKTEEITIGQALQLNKTSLLFTENTLNPVAGQALNLANSSLSLSGKQLLVTVGANIPVVAALQAGFFGVDGKQLSIQSGQVAELVSGSFALTNAQQTLSIGSSIPIIASSLSFATQSLPVKAGFVEVIGPATITIDNQSFQIIHNTSVLINITKGRLSLSESIIDSAQGQGLSIQSGSISINGQVIDLQYVDHLTIDSARLVIIGGIERTGVIQTFDRIVKTHIERIVKVN